MNIFLNLDGTAQIVDPTPVYQGSNAVTNIIVQSFMPITTAMELFFVMPDVDGTILGPYVMTTVTPPSGTEGLNYWSWSLIKGITALAGTVNVIIDAISGVPPDPISGGQNTTSFSCAFDVVSGVLPFPPPFPPTQDQWQQLVLLYQQLAARLQAKTLLDFTVNPQTGIGTKYYSDGTTANIQFPSGGSPPYIKTDWLSIISFPADESAWILNADNTYEIAFGPQQTGYTDNNYISILDKADSKTYEAGTSETIPSLHTGYSQLADTFFKGSDGSLLLSGITTPFAGRLVLLGGSAFSGMLATTITFNPNTSVLTITYVNGSIENIQLPPPTAAGRYITSFQADDWQSTPTGSELPYSVSITAQTHGRGLNPLWRYADNQWFDTSVSADGSLTVYSNTKKAMTVIIM